MTTATATITRPALKLTTSVAEGWNNTTRIHLSPEFKGTKVIGDWATNALEAALQADFAEGKNSIVHAETPAQRGLCMRLGMTHVQPGVFILYAPHPSTTLVSSASTAMLRVELARRESQG